MGHRTAYPNYARIFPDGSISAVFPGGVEIPTHDQSVGGSPIRPGVGVIWKQDQDGALLAQITTTAWHKPGSSTPRQARWQLTLTTDPANAGAATAGSGGLSVDTGDGVLGGADVRAQASKLTGDTHDVRIIDDAGTSNFQQWDSPQQFVSRFFSISIGALPAGSETAGNIAIPWTSALYMLGGLVGAFSGAQGQLCTWCYNPNTPGNVVVTIRNNSPFGMAGGTVLQGEARYI